MQNCNYIIYLLIVQLPVKKSNNKMFMKKTIDSPPFPTLDEKLIAEPS